MYSAPTELENGRSLGDSPGFNFGAQTCLISSIESVDSDWLILGVQMIFNLPYNEL